ncbi:MAG: DUF4238 domain-containing protein [Dongiaceae bacterium]
MAPERRRNHFIPIFLLNRFASKSNEKKKIFKIWEISKSSLPRLMSTRNVGFERDFYGGEDTGIEVAFSKEESNFGQVLTDIDRGRSPSELNDELTRFVWLQTIRTRALRLQFESLGQLLFDMLQEDEVVLALVDKIKSDFITNQDRHIEAEIKKLPPHQRATARVRARHPVARSIIGKMLTERITPEYLAKQIDSLRARANDQRLFEKSAVSGQLRGLRKLIEEGVSPPHFQPASWVVMQSGPDQVYLGDLCAFSISDSGETGSLMKHGKNWDEVYFPISSKMILVARKGAGHPRLTNDEVNMASVEHSLKYIYAKECPPAIDHLRDRIGKRAEVITRAEAESILFDSVLRKAAEPDSNV